MGSYTFYIRYESSSLPFTRPIISHTPGGYRSHTCTRFPSRSECEHGPASSSFCILWSTSGYLSQLSSVFAIVGLVAIIAASLSRARRRRLWVVVSGLEMIRAACQIGAMGVVVGLWRKKDYRPFEGSDLSALNLLPCHFIQYV